MLLESNNGGNNTATRAVAVAARAAAVDHPFLIESISLPDSACLPAKKRERKRH